jgi:hypothetical protein
MPALQAARSQPLILQALMGIRRGSGITVKGGVNLRLFFGSERYSEDMDLDGTAQARDAIRTTIHGMFEDKVFTQRRTKARCSSSSARKPGGGTPLNWRGTTCGWPSSP